MKDWPILVTHIYKNNWRKLLKKLLQVRPETATRRKKKTKKVEWHMQSFLYYTQRIKTLFHIKNT